MKERIKFALVAAMLMILAGLSWLLPLRYVIEGGSGVGISLALLLSAVITAFSALYVRHEHRNASAGFPLTDERSKVAWAQTGNYAFFVSAALALLLFALSLLGFDLLNSPEIQAGEVLVAIIIMMALVYFGTWALLTYRRRVD